jgi:hypothetical protein
MDAMGVGQTDRGKVRESNEEFFLVDNDLSLFVVSDGMGGHAAGESCGRLMTVVDGSFRLEENGRVLLHLRPGDHLGETTLLNPRPCRTTLRAGSAAPIGAGSFERFLGLRVGHRALD